MEWEKADSWPDWPDVGRKIRVEINGQQHIGHLQAEEFFTGEDEVPVFTVETESGGVSFVDADKWRFEDFSCGSCSWHGEEDETQDHFCPKCGAPTTYYDDDLP